MLVSKINPPATKIMQNNPFATTTITGESMTGVCTKYVIGAIPDSFNDDSVFLVKFGNIKYELKKIVQITLPFVLLMLNMKFEC